MKIVVVQENQTIYDIALQEYGSVEGIFQIMEDNEVDLETNVTVDQEILIDQDQVIDQSVVDYYAKEGILVANGTVDEDFLNTSGFTTGFKQNAFR